MPSWRSRLFPASSRVAPDAGEVDTLRQAAVIIHQGAQGDAVAIDRVHPAGARRLGRRPRELQQVLDDAGQLAVDRPEFVAAQVLDLLRDVLEVELGVHPVGRHASQDAGLLPGPGVEVGLVAHSTPPFIGQPSVAHRADRPASTS
jgi:hypothetical protein